MTAASLANAVAPQEVSLARPAGFGQQLVYRTPYGFVASVTATDGWPGAAPRGSLFGAIRLAARHVQTSVRRVAAFTSGLFGGPSGSRALRPPAARRKCGMDRTSSEVARESTRAPGRPRATGTTVGVLVTETRCGVSTLRGPPLAGMPSVGTLRKADSSSSEPELLRESVASVHEKVLAHAGARSHPFLDSAVSTATRRKQLPRPRARMLELRKVAFTAELAETTRFTGSLRSSRRAFSGASLARVSEVFTRGSYSI